jgi:putative FmdB family regulatory protein
VPIYEYRCKKCGAEYEQVRSIATMDARRACPTCKSRATERILTSRFAYVGDGVAPPPHPDMPPDDDISVAAEYKREVLKEDPDAMTAADWYNDP